MQYTIPDYYKEFTCIADQCPDTCCAGWQIMIDDRTMKKYRKMRGPFGTRLRNGIDWKEEAFVQHKGRCEFLNEKQLCDIYCEAGKDMLCKTCSRYPRHIEEFEGLREISLSISCPEAARIILSQEEKVRFLHKERQTAEETYDSFDFLLFTNLMDARDYVLELLQDRSQSIGNRMAKALAYVHDVQLAIEKGEQYRCQEIRECHQKTGFSTRFFQKWNHITESVQNKEKNMEKLWKTLIPNMEVLREEWPGYVEECLGTLYGKEEGSYERALEAFHNIWPQWEIEAEQILVYWVFTYFCGAVYDGDAFSKMKLAVVSTLLVRDLDAACLIQKGCFDKETQISNCYRYSRELEHSDLNLNSMEELLAKEDVFSFDKLLRLCEN